MGNVAVHLLSWAVVRWALRPARPVRCPTSSPQQHAAAALKFPGLAHAVVVEAVEARSRAGGRRLCPAARLCFAARSRAGVRSLMYPLHCERQLAGAVVGKVRVAAGCATQGPTPAPASVCCHCGRVWFCSVLLQGLCCLTQQRVCVFVFARVARAASRIARGCFASPWLCAAGNRVALCCLFCCLTKPKEHVALHLHLG